MELKNNDYAPPEHLRFAKVLRIGVRAGFALLVIGFAAYLAGVLEPVVPIDQLPNYWGLSAAEFARVTGAPTGWAWLAQLGKGDVLNLAGIVWLSAVSSLAVLAVVPIFARRGETAQVIICLLLVAVLALAAANVLAPT